MPQEEGVEPRVYMTYQFHLEGLMAPHWAKNLMTELTKLFLTPLSLPQTQLTYVVLPILEA